MLPAVELALPWLLWHQACLAQAPRCLPTCKAFLTSWSVCCDVAGRCEEAARLPAAHQRPSMHKLVWAATMLSAVLFSVLTYLLYATCIRLTLDRTMVVLMGQAGLQALPQALYRGLKRALLFILLSRITGAPFVSTFLLAVQPEISCFLSPLLLQPRNHSPFGLCAGCSAACCRAGGGGL